jgi:predicted nucleotide-binding protein
MSGYVSSAVIEELTALAHESERIASTVKVQPFSTTVSKITEAIEQVGASSSQSWIGYHSRMYYSGFRRPPASDAFSSEWGLASEYFPPSDNWQEVDYEKVYEHVMGLAERPDTKSFESAAAQAAEMFEQNRDELIAILNLILDHSKSSAVEEIRDEVRKLKLFTAAKIIDMKRPERVMTRDTTALSQGLQPPHHFKIAAWLLEQQLAFQSLEQVAKLAKRAAGYLSREVKMNQKSSPETDCIFIGHGGDSQWKDVADFVQTRLKLTIEEFNHHPPAGMTTQERLDEMLQKATFALLIMTAEDEHADSTKHARENVIHEIGRAQQRLGLRRAIILLEEGCGEFSNIAGVNQIRFPKGYISATFEEIRRVLEREGLIPA